MTQLKEGDHAVIPYGKHKGQQGIVKHLGNLFGNGNVVSLGMGEGHWIEIPLRQARKSNA